METLTDSARITGLLKRLQEHRALLSVRIEGQEQEFTTAIVTLSSEQGYLMLDELKPHEGHDLLKHSPNIKVRAQLEGVVMYFNTTVTEFGEQDAIAFYRVTIPTMMEYLQRRQSVRIPMSIANPLPVTVTTEDGKVLKGKMSDISIGGLRIHFDGDLPASLEAGQKLDCSFPLPPDNKERFTCELIIRVIKARSDTLRTAFIGGEFLDLAKPQERQIERAVMLLQRVAQQKRNG